MKIREKIRKIGSMLPVLVLGILACATVAMAAGSVSHNIYGSPYETGLTIEKRWVDDGHESKRPESITVRYKMTMVFSDSTGKTDTRIKEDNVVLSKANSWKENITWDYRNESSLGFSYHLGRDLTVEVEEVDVPDGYTVEYDWKNNVGVVVVNTYTGPVTGELSVKKTVSGDGADKTKKFDFTLNLTDGSGQALPDSYSYIIQNEDGSSAGTGSIGNGGTFSLSHGQTLQVTGLPEGSKYSVTEAKSEDYTSQITSGSDSGTIAADTPAAVVFDNAYEEKKPERINISGTKTWKDDEDQAGIRPDSIEVKLWAGKTLEATQTVDESDGWTYRFDGLDKYDQQGREITYTVTETPVEGYTTTYEGYDIINSYTPEKPEVPEENTPSPKTG
ncbi:Cna B-type domain-containing protein, partial [Massilistercora timonensis]|uniref:Cna B-type domain-containing protein n=1 Tax=Massilistercora timonensis TaxID=2086584 RepID=UPI003AB8E644